MKKQPFLDEAIMQLSPGLQMELFDAVDDFKQQPEYGDLFDQPVDYVGPPALENYIEIVQRPMSYATLQVNLNRREYTFLYQFLIDLSLIFENCRKYNNEELYFTRAANSAEKFCVAALQQLPDLQFLTMDAYYWIISGKISLYQSLQMQGASAARIRQLYIHIEHMRKSQLDKVFGNGRVTISYKNCAEFEQKILELSD